VTIYERIWACQEPSDSGNLSGPDRARLLELASQERRRPSGPAAMKQDTTLVIVTYNSAHLLEERLGEYAGRPVVIVDNASSDGTAGLVSSSFPEVDVIQNDVNSGYGRAANQGFERVVTRFALLVNPDARISSEGIAALEAEASGLDDDWLFIAPNTGVIPEPRVRVSSTLEEVDAASGAALFFDVECLRRFGAFDPSIFLFFEETDLCRRAMRDGVKLYYAADIPVEHELGTSTHSSIALEYLRKWHYNWASLYYHRKHRLWSRYFGTLWRNLVVAGFKLMTSSRNQQRYVLCHARHHSARAHLFGRGAFLPSGEPFREEFLRELEGRSPRDVSEEDLR